MQELNFEVDQIVNNKDDVISFKCELHENLQKAMKKFVEERPNLDQYEIIHRAIAGFLMDKGFYNREITKLIGIKIFSKKF